MMFGCDADAEQIVRTRMRERGMTFKEAINDAIRSAGTSRRKAFRTKTASLGQSGVNLDHALQVAAELEDDELVRKARLGS